MKYCSSCAHEVVRKIPEGEDRERDVCPSCGEIFYVNPKIIVGCIPMVGDQVLLCKRAIEPRCGKWTLPAGFMENRETTAEGAAREMWEEAEARAVDMALYRIFDVPTSARYMSFTVVRCWMDSLAQVLRVLKVRSILRLISPGMSSRSPLSSRCSESFLRTAKPRSFRYVTARSGTKNVVMGRPAD